MSRESKFKFVIYDDKNLIADIRTATLDEILKAEEAYLPSGFSYKALQYIGLKDKNGKEICDGDVISQISSEGEELIHIVGYEKYEARFVAYFKSSYNLDRSYCGLVARWTDEKEVVGNIYENPKLLKEAK